MLRPWNSVAVRPHCTRLLHDRHEFARIRNRFECQNAVRCDSEAEYGLRQVGED